MKKVLFIAMLLLGLYNTCFAQTSVEIMKERQCQEEYQQNNQLNLILGL